MPLMRAQSQQRSPRSKGCAWLSAKNSLLRVLLVVAASLCRGASRPAVSTATQRRAYNAVMLKFDTSALMGCGHCSERFQIFNDCVFLLRTEQRSILGSFVSGV